MVRTTHFHCRGHGFNPWWRSRKPRDVGKKKKKIQKVNDLLFCDDEVMQPFLGIQFPYCLDSVRYWREDISFILEASYTSLGREAEERSEI